VASFLDASLLLFFHRTDLSVVSGLQGLLMLFIGVVTYAMMAFAPSIPKRYFVPVSLFLPVAYVAILPLLVYFHRQALLIIWGVTILHIVLGFFILRRLRGDGKIRWPFVPDSSLGERKFSWGNLVAVTLAAVLLVVPGLVLYSAYSVKLAVSHFSDGFVILRPSGISMQVRKYVREDGRKITLVPMSHIGEEKFYRELSASFPANALILMEGVTDHKRVVKGKLNYSKMAAAAGGVEQATAFQPQGEIVHADVDLSSFSPATLEMVENAMLVHSKGITPETLPILMKPSPPGFEKELLDDLLTKRNRHLLKVIQECLLKPGDIIVPWGAAHMPEIAREIQKSGFRMTESQEFLAIRFGS
jgi:hypothetical protein